MQRESEWAWGVVTADGGSAPLGRGLAVSPPPPSRPPPHDYPLPTPRKHPHTTLCCESSLVASTVRVL